LTWIFNHCLRRMLGWGLMAHDSGMDTRSCQCHWVQRTGRLGNREAEWEVPFDLGSERLQYETQGLRQCYFSGDHENGFWRNQSSRSACRGLFPGQKQNFPASSSIHVPWLDLLTSTRKQNQVLPLKHLEDIIRTSTWELIEWRIFFPLCEIDILHQETVGEVQNRNAVTHLF